MKKKEYFKISILAILFALSAVLLFGLSQTMKPGILAKMPKNLNAVTENADEIYSVNFALNTGVWIDGTSGSKIVNVNSGEKVEELKDNIDCEKEGHYLEGWYLDTKFQNKYDFNLPVTENLILYANWVPKEYTVKFYNTYNSLDGTQELLATYEIPYGYTLVLDNASEENKTFEYTGEIPTKQNYKFVDWISDTGTYSIIGDTNFTARFTGDTIYYITLKYVYQNGNMAATNYTTTLTEGESYSIDTEELEGYTANVNNVSGIATKDELSKLGELEYVEIDDSASGLYKVTYTITYTPAPSSYSVEHYLQNLDGTYSIVSDDTTTIDNCFVGDIVKAETNEYEGYTLNYATSTLEGAVEVNGTLVLKAYYDRNTYYIYWDSKEGTYYNPTPVVYGTDITNIGDEKIPEKTGYTFVRWEESTGISYTTMPTKNIQYVAVWEKEKTSYTITYWIENANNEGFTNSGNYTISNIDTESSIDIESTEVVNNIETGFENLVTSDYVDYYYYDEDKTKEAIDGDYNSYPVQSDGTTIINVYYKRKIYTLRFIIGRDNNGSNQISPSTQGSISASSWQTVSEKPYIIKNDTTYYTDEYTISAKYGADISKLWPSVDDAIDNVSYGSTSYYFISWGTQTSSESNSYWQNHTNKNILGIYGTMSEELIMDKTDTSAEHLLIAYWSTTARYFKYHYMFEKLDQTEATNYTYTYNGETKYYEEGQVAIVRSTNTAENLSGAALANKKLVGKYTEATGQGSTSESTAVDIYYYYDLDEHIITLYNVNQNVVPNFTSDELSELSKNGINIENNQIIAKYGANIQILNELRDSFDEYDNFKYPLTLIGKKEKVFDKWYLEPNYLTEMDWEDTNLVTIENNITLYAKWADPTYNVVFTLEGGTWQETDSNYVKDENGDYQLTVEEGVVLEEPEAPTRTGYKFTSWMYELDINGYTVEIPYLFGASQKIYDDLKLIARWTAEEKYVSYYVNYVKAEYDENGKVINDITKYNDVVKIADTKRVDNVLFNSVVSETALDVIVYNGEEYYIADAASRSLTVNAENDEDNVIYFFYSNLLEIQYTVYYVEQGTEYEIGEVPDASRMLADPKYVTVQTSKGSFYTETALDIGGYTPVGSWTKSIQLVSDFSKNTLYFYYEPNQDKGNYDINFYFMNENGTYDIVPTETVKGTGPVGKILYAEDYIEYEGTDETYFIGHVLDYSISDAVGVVTKASDAVLNVYFKNGTYSVTYNLEGGVWTDTNSIYVENDDGNYVEMVTYPLNAQIPENPTREGYNFVGWFKDNISQEESNKYDFSTKVSSNTEVYAGWIETVNKTVTVVWDDDNNRDDIRPENLEVQVILDGITSDDNKLTLSATNNWQFEYKDLDKYLNGNERTFSIREDIEVSGYTVEYDQDTLTIKLIHTPEITTKTITKIWNDKDNQDGIRPEEIIIDIYENGKLAREIVLDESNKQTTVMPDVTGEYWSVTLTDLPKNSEGIEIEYTVSEKDAVEKYTTEYNQDSLTIINTHEVELTDKEVEIIWDDNNNQDGKRENVTIQLYENNVATGKIITLDANNENTYTFEDLEKYSNGKEIEYTVKQENTIEGYTTTYSTDTFTITNTHIPETKDQTVTKIWRDGDNKDLTRPGSINVQLYANGTKVGDKVTLTLDNATVFENSDGETILGNNWEYTWKDLPVYEDGEEIEYVVIEDSVANYSTRYSKKSLTIYNAYPPEVNIVAQKVWDDQEDRDGIRPEKVEVQLYADGQEFSVDGENIGQIELNEENNWKYEWPYLEKYNSEGEIIDYTVKELTEVPKYTTTYMDTGEVTVMDVAISSERTFEVINSYEPKERSINAIVKWEDNNNQDGIRPESVNLELVATLSDGAECTFESETSKKVEVTADNTWKHTWGAISLNANHGEEIKYTLKETEISGYTYSVEYDEESETLIITNTHIPEVIEKTIKVNWEDNDNQDGIRPEKLDITVNKEDSVMSEIEVTEENDWEAVISDLERYEDGQEIKYSVEKNLFVDGYSVEYSEDTFTITLTHIPETIEKELKIVWNDGNNQDGIRPEEITVTVLKDDKNIEKVTLSEDNNWKKTYLDLNKYEDGKEVIYSVKQNISVDKYSVEYSEDTFTITLTYVPETITKQVIKVWNDNFDQDGIRPSYIDVGLFADGEKIDEVKLETANGWQYEFEDLAKNKQGIQIEYTVEELTKVTGYTPSYTEDGDTILYILNNHDIETVTKTVKVEFEDSENQDGIRPEEITVTILKDGEEYQTITITAENNWQVEIVGEKYKEQGKEVVYSVKQDVSIDKYETTYNDLTIVNKYTPEKTEKTVTVRFEDNNNQDGIRPDEVEVELLADNVVIDTQKVTSTDNWTYTWDTIDKYVSQGQEIEYTVRQKTSIDGYVTTYEDLEIVNTHIPNQTEKTVKVVWEDNNNQDGIRPSELTVKLLKNGLEYKEATIKNDTWEYTFTELPEYENGVEVEYTVKESISISEYVTTYSEDKLTITNTHTPEKVSKTAEKIWNDDNNAYGVRPEEVEIQLYANGTKIGNTEKLNDANNWKYTWDNLEKYENGHEISYTVKEINLPAKYSVTYENDGLGVVNTCPPQANKTVKVVWDDNEDVGGIRPESINVKLTATLPDGTVFDISSMVETDVELNADNNWTYTWNVSQYKVVGLNVDDWIEINYSIEEIDTVPNYQTEYSSKEFGSNSNITITNTLNKFEYTVNYYYDGVKDENETVVKEAFLNNGITTYEDKIKTGYRLEDVTGIPLQIKGDSSQNIINVYYVRKDTKVTIKYIDKVSKEEIDIQKEIEGKYGDKVTLADYKEDLIGYVYLGNDSGETDSISMIEENKVITYSYAKEANVIVKYLEKDTNEVLVAEKEIEGYEGKEYKTTAEVIDGYRLEVTPENSSGTMSAGETIVTYQYVQATKVVTEYVDKYTNDVLDKVETTGYVGDTVKVNTKEIDGYHLLEGQIDKEVTLTKDVQTVQYQYAKETKVIVKFLERDTDTELAEEVTIEGYQGKNYEAESIDIDEYTLVSDTNKVTDVMPRNEYTVKFYYAKQTKITVEYIDKMTSEKLDNVVDDVLVGDKYTSVAKAFDGYVLTQSPESETVTITKEEQVLRYYYTKVSEGVIVKYVDEITNSLLDEVVITGLEGDNYTTETKTFTGYTFIKTDGQTEGSLSSDITEVKYYYRKNMKVVVEHIDKISNTVLETETITGYENKEYTSEDKAIDGYKIVEEPANKEGIMKEDITYVRYYYKYISLVKIHYVDINSNEVLDSTTINGLEADEYTTEEKTIDNYVLIEVTNNKTGHMTKDTINVYYKYAKVSAGVEVNYIDKITNEIMKTEVIPGYEAKEYEAEQKSFDEYDIVTEDIPGNISGKMTVEKTTVNIYYIAKSKIVVKYIEKISGKQLVEDVVIEGHETDEYTTDEKQVQYYKLIENTDNISGNMEKGTEEVIYYYRKLEFKARVDKSLTKATLNGKNIKIVNNTLRLDVKSKEIEDTDLVLEYTIRISNTGELAGRVDLEEILNDSLIFDANNSSEIWIKEKNKLTTSVDIAVGEVKELKIVLKWNAKEKNLGDITPITNIVNVENEAGFIENEVSENLSTEVVVGIFTGLENGREILIVTLIALVIVAVRLQEKKIKLIEVTTSDEIVDKTIENRRCEENKVTKIIKCNKKDTEKIKITKKKRTT